MMDHMHRKPQSPVTLSRKAPIARRYDSNPFAVLESPQANEVSQRTLPHEGGSVTLWPLDIRRAEFKRGILLRATIVSLGVCLYTAPTIGYNEGFAALSTMLVLLTSFSYVKVRDLKASFHESKENKEKEK
jgi:hypothetical protein